MALSFKQASRSAQDRVLKVARRLNDAELCRLLRTSTAMGGPARSPAVTGETNSREVEPRIDPRLSDSSRDQISTRLMDLFRRTRDLEAFECLYEANCGILLRSIQARLRHFSVFLDSSDILQDAFFNIYRYPRRFRPDRPSAFRVWASSIVQNTIRRHLKRQLRREMGREVDVDRVSDRVDPGGEPSELLSAKEQVGGLRKGYLVLLGMYLAAYDGLSDRDRRVLSLVEVDGLRYKDAAVIIGVRPANMKMLVFRARQKISRVIAQGISEGESRLSA